MSRNEKILKHINKNDKGLEIGPSYNPIATKKDGYNVHILDHLSREELVEKYKRFDIEIDKIEDVDFVWKGQQYSELTGKHKYYDWIIASHVIEHTPDLIWFLNECDSILKETGIIYLVVPDKRFFYDHYRPISGISKIIDNHFQKKKFHTIGSIAEYYLNAVTKSGSLSWDINTLGSYEFVYSIENALHWMTSFLNEGLYVDVHNWCFVPHSFRLIVHDLYCLNLTSFQEIEFYPTEGCEFYITIGREKKGGTRISRAELLKKIESEIMGKL